MKTPLSALPLSVFALALSASAAVPVRWTVETSRVQPAQFDAYHGETLELEAALQSYGKPLAITNAVASIYWQTNGMGSAYWSAPASVSNHVLRARWTPAMDVGATVYQGFVGLAGEIYRAAFQLRLRQSPGAVPSELPLPVKTLDFAQVTVVNAPYYTRSETDARIIELAPTPGNYATVSNRAMNAVQPSAISDMETQTHAAATYQPKGSYLTAETDPTVDGKISTHNSSASAHNDIRTALAEKLSKSDVMSVWNEDDAVEGQAAEVTSVQEALDDIDATSVKASTYMGYGDYEVLARDVVVDDLITPDPNYYIPNVLAVNNALAGKQAMISDLATIRSGAAAGATALQSYTETDPTVSSWAKATTKPTYNWSEIGSKPTIPTDSTVSGWGYLKSESDPTVDAKLGPVETTVNAWQTYWSGDDVRVTVTNYYGSQDLPSLYLEQKISEGGTNYFKTIWTEKARLNLINDRLDDLEADVETKADRAWGFYDSHSGTWAPDGFTAISSGSILISKDMSYQKNITSGGEVWVLTSNDPTVISGTETNGFFKIADSEGNSILEVVKGDKRVVPATVSAVSAGGNSLTISYNVVAAQHPSIEICSDLVEADWKAEDEASCPATVVWSGSSGNYVATVTGKAAMPKMFVKGTYEVGGETYIKNSAPLGFEKVVIGGVYYRVTVETVSGRKLMVLTEL